MLAGTPWAVIEGVVKIAADTIAFMRSLPGYLATRDATNQPTAVEAAVLELDPDTGVGEIAANLRYARGTADNLRDNGAFAMEVSRPFGDHRSVQIKGRCLGVTGPGHMPDRLRGCIDGLAAELTSLGVSKEVADAYRTLERDAYYLVSIQIDEVYEQTPGPDAGRRVE